MATHVIEVDPLNPISVIKAYFEMCSITNEFNNKVSEVLKRIADIGANAARGAYGGNAVSVYVTQDGKGYTIHADGKAVVFLEFGAGDTVNVSNMFKGEVESQGHFEISSGSWSRSDESETHEYRDTGKWHFGGREYSYIEPRNGLQKAYDAIIQDIRKVAREVYG